eukprot:m.35912 g.35912  ORF g.35912 m.35912 type:complete len:430 (+) comp12819_c0_seq1:111-1400(+)
MDPDPGLKGVPLTSSLRNTSPQIFPAVRVLLKSGQYVHVFHEKGTANNEIENFEFESPIWCSFKFVKTVLISQTSSAMMIEESPEPSDIPERYTWVKHLGDGQYGTVYLATDSHNGDRKVAIKKIKMGGVAEAMDGVPRDAVKEIKFLQEIKHENVCQLLDVFGKESNMHLVLEVCEGKDLEKLIHDKRMHFTPGDIKAYLLMTCKGLEFLHSHWILHRDMKSANLLITANGIVKICDFGFATFYGSPSRPLSSQVVTLWYRAPELLMGAKVYGVGVDMWAVGCIQAELEQRFAIFPGDMSDLSQLEKIFTEMGTPSEESWPGVTALPNYVPFNPIKGTPLAHHFTAMSPDAVSLMDGLLSMCPATRLTATEALQHPYFSNKPAPTPSEYLPKPLPPPPKESGGALKRRFNFGDEDDAEGLPAKTLKFG